ncbi:MAG: cytochrome P450 [Gammaproteobacteria bacterium]|jgi:cytochrome P450|nr:cytochrome P450 [Gammaproteobacteria bacterium]MBT3870568.1 cytochrome P450 [Gammaproteobacteria bacterium]MBT4378999.1 cytochrome P450 [Gammaproteobacteria bacterium]MBT4616653.1 cytochrome P450 [Gammaproteobacteria bacterium]MBT5791455.1 cytochrome P450 [Gammaproteobacteria bacterium]
MSEQKKESESTIYNNPFLRHDAPPVIEDPYSVPIEEINPIDGRLFQMDIHEAHFKRLREEDPVHMNELPMTGRYWSITKFEDIMYVDKNHELFSSASGITLGPRIDLEPGPAGVDFSNFIAMDPPKHDLQRATVSSVVAPPNLAKMQSLIRERAGTILDGLPVAETFNWVDLVSIELTTQMLATLFDFPFEDRRMLTRWSDVATAPPGTGIVDTAEQRRDELLECLAYFTRLWNERAAMDNPGSDLISMLAHGEDTKNMAPYEFLGNLILLIVGGNDTTRNSISGGVLALNQNPEEYDKLRNNPELIPNMVAEIIRWQTPLPYMRRTANQDVELRGKKIRKGEQLLMWYISGNRDEEVIDNPSAFIIDRPNARHHLSFGFGIHRCMGNRLAEMQLRIVWEEILKRFHKVEVVGEPERLRSSFVRGITNLPVQVHPL